MLAVAAYLGASAIDASMHFSRAPELLSAVAPLREALAPFRLVSTYHLFAAITRERVEPELQTLDGAAWTAHDLHHKPGDVARAPDLVAPHQPRVDFQLWFYGLSHGSGVPPYVERLLEQACHDPAALSTLFREPLPEGATAARMAFFRYHFTTPAQRAATGAWWTREWVGATKPVRCR